MPFEGVEVLKNKTTFHPPDDSDDEEVYPVQKELQEQLLQTVRRHDPTLQEIHLLPSHENYFVDSLLLHLKTDSRESSQ